MEDAPILEKLWREYDDSCEELIVAEEEVIETRNQLKIITDKLKRAKSSVYQATKIRKELKALTAIKKRRATSYSSLKRAWAKKNMGKVFDSFEEDL